MLQYDLVDPPLPMPLSKGIITLHTSPDSLAQPGGRVAEWVKPIGLCSMADLIGVVSIPMLAIFVMAVFYDSLQWHPTALKRPGLCVTVCGSMQGKDPFGPIEKTQKSRG